MKVISGKYRGRQLVALPGLNTRPTSARVKEDMFNILTNWFIYEGKISLDLFAGSGALSIEGLSRGIEFAYINDWHNPALEIVKKNLKNIPASQFQITNWEFKRVLDYLHQSKKNVDLIYLDPPFPQVNYYYEFFEKIATLDILAENGVIMTEAPELLDLSKINHLTLLKYKDFKNKHFYLFRLERQENGQ
ncbi:N6-adenine-specific methylase [Spiroplasma sabaudiense Ar-1343]|uniref:N6-adenine-specific methylase n=1 Tax=Spiroplasma sabaudiense Ar-1343 TaxID=1276257 RepID=W6AA52_9MOLU|nr:16S rRNA (guanine(966)-N(2))-methyltransferase RsmD [Spiroplasma sabaudiense]AHI54068.1 N6-adenine-specific methylase [Spiroplasma sabaudiense Ar-1343]